MSKTTINTEERSHIEDEPEQKVQEDAVQKKSDTPADAPDNPVSDNAASSEKARTDSSRIIKIFLATVAVLAAVFCVVYFGLNSRIGSGPSGRGSKTTSSAASDKPNANTLAADDRIVGNYSMHDDEVKSWNKECADYLMPDFELPFTLNNLAASSPSELSELLSKLTDRSTSDYHRFTGRDKTQLFKDEFTNPEALEYREDPWGITVDTKDENGESIGTCSLADIKKAAEIEQIEFKGAVPIEDPTYGDICKHVAQVFDYEKIGLEQITTSDETTAVQGCATANGIATRVWVDLEPSYFNLTVIYNPTMLSYEYGNQIIEGSAFQAYR